MTHPIIVAACQMHGIEVECFLGHGRSERLMACRAEAVQALRHRGHSWKSIANLTGRGLRAIQLWGKPERRAKHNIYQRERWHEIYKTADLVREGII